MSGLPARVRLSSSGAGWAPPLTPNRSQPMTAKKPTVRPSFEALETRELMAASLIGSTGAVTPPARTDAAVGGQVMVFIDPSVPDYRFLAAAATSAEVMVLDANRDG